MGDATGGRTDGVLFDLHRLGEVGDEVVVARRGDGREQVRVHGAVLESPAKVGDILRAGRDALHLVVDCNMSTM